MKEFYSTNSVDKTQLNDLNRGTNFEGPITPTGAAFEAAGVFASKTAGGSNVRCLCWLGASCFPIRIKDSYG